VWRDGANVSEFDDEPAELLFDPTACTYQVIFTYGIAISSSSDVGEAPATPEPDMDDEVVTPSEPIPANLDLTGSASPQIDLSGGGNAATGSYELAGDSYGVNDWPQALEYANDGSTSAVGTGTVSWHFTPIYFSNSSPSPTPNNPTPTSTTKCTVPALKGKSESKAKKAITKAHCAVGKIKHKRSHKVKKGHVISSSPGAGTKHAAGTKVKLVLSSG
jgi:PASTA domain